MCEVMSGNVTNGISYNEETKAFSLLYKSVSINELIPKNASEATQTLVPLNRGLSERALLKNNNTCARETKESASTLGAKRKQYDQIRDEVLVSSTDTERTLNGESQASCCDSRKCTIL